MSKKVYGNRWEEYKYYDKGGQSLIFLVTDKTNEYKGFQALKTLKNPKKPDRFIQEIEACKTLKHQNIIPIIDHSIYNNPSEKDKMFMVMPLMQGGNLVKRKNLYKDSIDSTLPIILELCNALIHAHDNGIIHRDIKPGNILFQEVYGNQCVIADFGICFFYNSENRFTENDEIVGARNFMAPELEEGGKLDVEPSVDIYSLGKIIYYMISGGVIMPREKLSDPKYDIFQGKGLKFQILKSLLEKMITSKENRLKNIENVSAELMKILNLEITLNSPIQIPESVKRNIENIIKTDSELKDISDYNNIIIQKDRENKEAFLINFKNWLQTELNQFVAQLPVIDNITFSILEIPPTELNGKIKIFKHQSHAMSINLSITIQATLPKNRYKDQHLIFIVQIENNTRYYQSLDGKPSKYELTEFKFYFFPIYWCNKKLHYLTHNVFSAPAQECRHYIHYSIKNWTEPENVVSLKNLIVKSFEDFMSNVSSIKKDTYLF